MNAYCLICDCDQWVIFRVDFVPMTDHQDDSTDSSEYRRVARSYCVNFPQKGTRMEIDHVLANGTNKVVWILQHPAHAYLSLALDRTIELVDASPSADDLMNHSAIGSQAVTIRKQHENILPADEVACHGVMRTR